MKTPTVASLLAIELPPVVSPPLLWRLQLFQYFTATKKAFSELVSHLIHDNSLSPIPANVLDVHYQYKFTSSLLHQPAVSPPFAVETPTDAFFLIKVFIIIYAMCVATAFMLLSLLW